MLLRRRFPLLMLIVVLLLPVLVIAQMACFYTVNQGVQYVDGYYYLVGCTSWLCLQFLADGTSYVWDQGYECDFTPMF